MPEFEADTPALREEVGRRWFEAMRRGDWEAAWRQTDRIERGRRAAESQPGFEHQPHHLLWNGRPFDGARVVVHCNHGLGDTLQFLRFVPVIAARAREVHLLVQPPLLRLLTGAPELSHVRDAWTDDPWPPHDVSVEVMELAYALRATPQSLPPPYPHLAHCARARSSYRLVRDEAPRVGVLWAASDWDTSRSIPPALLAPLFEVQGVRFHSLQQGPAATHSDLASFDLEPTWQHTAAIENAAAAMLDLDLVITVDGMAAHLAGSLGRPVWLLLKQDADWRWMDARSDSPWYPGMTLWRQAPETGWPELLSRVAAALHDWRAARMRWARTAEACSRTRKDR